MLGEIVAVWNESRLSLRRPLNVNDESCESVKAKPGDATLKNLRFGTDVSGARRRVPRNMFCQITASADSPERALVLVNFRVILLR